MLLPLQGDIVCVNITQGVALGFELVGFQPVIGYRGFAIGCRGFAIPDPRPYLTFVGILLSLMISFPVARASSSTDLEVKSGVL